MAVFSPRASVNTATNKIQRGKENEQLSQIYLNRFIWR